MKRVSLQLSGKIAFFCFVVCLASPASAQIGATGNTNFGNQGTTGQRDYFSQGMVGEAYVEYDYDTRSIIVIADEETNLHIQDIIRNLDRPVPQVLIKVVIAEITYRNDLDLGSQIGINQSGDESFTTNFGLEAEDFGGFFRVLENDLQVTVRAVEEAGNAEILSRPSVLTRNNQEAQIIVGREVPFVDTSTQTDSGQINTTIIYRPIGIILRVTPFITPDGLVEMIINPEISSIAEEVIQISEQVEAPVFNTRSADTVVTTPNGQTIVIGGLMEDNINDTDTKIPFLGDIPLIGRLFKRQENNNSKTELLIFLTPIVVQFPQDLQNLSNYENSRSKLVPQVFSKGQLDTYLDNLGNTSPFDLKDYTPENILEQRQREQYQLAPEQPVNAQAAETQAVKPQQDKSTKEEGDASERKVKPLRIN